jgi:TolB-like protein/class 3 adenylate cyclase
MPDRSVERKLSAIFAADIAGYSRLMARDEPGTLARLKACRSIIDGLIAAHRGRIFNTAGDSVVADFASAVDAVACAVAVQRAIAVEEPGSAANEPMRFRIGIHVGDVMVDGANLLGDGVNIAARLEGIAEPGGICVSRVVRDQIRDKLNAAFDDMGEQQVKNIPRPVRVFRVLAEGNPMFRPAGLPLPDKPSIAVLPFENMSGDSEQEYFADGMVEEIITALSRVRWLFVIARNSSFTYKGRAVDIKQVGRELGVRYVLEGSVRKGGDRVRITAQLIDATNGAHIWADRFDGTLEDIFDLQDQVTASIVGVIAPQLEQAEIARAKHKPTESLDAYDFYLRGVAGLHAVFEGDKDAVREALHRFYRAIELDPKFASAYGMAAWCCVLHKNYGWIRGRSRRIGASWAASGAFGKGGCGSPIHRRFCLGASRGSARRQRGLDRPRIRTRSQPGGGLAFRRLGQDLSRRAGTGDRAHGARNASQSSRSAHIWHAKWNRGGAFPRRSLRRGGILGRKSPARALQLCARLAHGRSEPCPRRSIAGRKEIDGTDASCRARPAHFEHRERRSISSARRLRQIHRGPAQGRITRLGASSAFLGLPWPMFSYSDVVVTGGRY